MISWGLCALPSAAGFAGTHSLCRIWRVCDCWACIWKCHHKNTPTFPKASLRLWLHWSSLTEHSVLCLIPSSIWIQTFWMFVSPDVCITRCFHAGAANFQKHLNVSAKVGWFCHLRRCSGIWVPEPCSSICSPACCSVLGLIILDLLWEPEHLCVWAAVTLGSYCCFLPWLVRHSCNDCIPAQRRLFCLSLFTPKELATLILH